MKLIPLRESSDQFGSRNVLKTIIGISPTKAITPIEMAMRLKILDKLEAANDQLAFVLEDAEHQCLKEAITTFPWSVANRNLMQVINDVIEAKEPPRD
jgi:hypothetical protein